MPQAEPSQYDSTFTGPVLDVGPSLEVDGTSSFAPAVGGPVMLDTGTLWSPATWRVPTASTPPAHSPWITLPSSTPPAPSMPSDPRHSQRNRFFGTALNLAGATTWQIDARPTSS